MLEKFGFCKPIVKKSSEITTSVCLSTAADLWRLNTSGNSPKNKQLWHLVGISSKHSIAEKMSRSCGLPRTCRFECVKLFRFTFTTRTSADICSSIRWSKLRKCAVDPLFVNPVSNQKNLDRTLYPSSDLVSHVSYLDKWFSTQRLQNRYEGLQDD